MAKSRRPRLRELRTIYLLVGECCELEDDAAIWRGHLINGLVKALGGDVGLSFEIIRPWSQGADIVGTVIETAWPTDTGPLAFRAFMGEGPMERAPMTKPIRSLNRPLVTRSRRQLVPDKEWYEHPFVKDTLEFAGIDDMIISAHRPASGSGQLLNISRSRTGRPFNDRERRLLHLCHREIAALVGRRLTIAPAHTQRQLPTRLQQVLCCLQEGNSEKQIATRLGITTNTAHEHVKRLHRHCGVHSRGELLASSRHPAPGLRGHILEDFNPASPGS